jgi:hypothetical protein
MDGIIRFCEHPVHLCTFVIPLSFSLSFLTPDFKGRGVGGVLPSSQVSPTYLHFWDRALLGGLTVHDARKTGHEAGHSIYVTKNHWERRPGEAERTVLEFGIRGQFWC